MTMKEYTAAAAGGSWSDEEFAADEGSLYLDTANPPPEGHTAYVQHNAWGRLSDPTTLYGHKVALNSAAQAQMIGCVLQRPLTCDGGLGGMLAMRNMEQGEFGTCYLIGALQCQAGIPLISCLTCPGPDGQLPQSCSLN